MSGWKKLASAAAASGGALNVEDVFSTFLYEGASANQSITNGIDLSTEGGLVWVKNRDNANDHVLVDTERGALNYLHSSQSYAEQDATTGINAFNTDGFDVDGIGALWNNSSYDYASWTFRKAPKFFDVVTYTGDGTAGRTISHNLGSVPGMIIVKARSSGQSWAVYHRGVASDPETDYLVLNDTNAAVDNALYWNDTAPTASNFTVGTRNNVNGNGITYVAYLFAHNDGDGGFGPTGDQDIIKCGSFTGTGSSAAIDLGFEPQFLLWKQYDGTDDWYIADSMRGITTQDINPPTLRPNLSNAENATSRLGITSTGFEFDGGSGSDYIYIAIRRGPMAVPESATDVFDATAYTSDGTNGRVISSTPSVVDLILNLNRDSNNTSVFYDRLRGSKKELSGRLTSAEQTASSEAVTLDTNAGTVVNNAGYYDYPNYGTEKQVLYSWKRAPNFFDVVAYTGNGTAGRTVSHNLGAVPEMMWVKNRGSNTSWHVYHSGMGNTKTMNLNGSGSEQTISVWNNTSPTDTQFTVGSSLEVNGYNAGMIAYLFATLSGVSKCGSYSGSSSAQNIDCGFSSGARFILIKCTSANDNWQVYDAERGIVAGNDPYLQLDSTAAEVSNSDDIDPYSSGFTLVGNRDATNAAGRNYIFYAIA